MVLATRLRTLEVVGSKEPRIWTKPLRELTPVTSYGYDVIEFARDVLKRPLDPWQEWLVVHAGELLEDGITPRFRQVLVLVARQNGKTFLLAILTLYWMYVERVKLILGTSTKLETAHDSWERAVDLARECDRLSRDIPKDGIRKANGQESLTIEGGSRYKIAASNSSAGRGLTVSRLIMDELRQHGDWTAYSASVPATAAVPDAQIWMITNQGDESATVLKSLRNQAIEGTDPRLGIFEWSAPDGCVPTDLQALIAANPSLGMGRLTIDSLMGDALRAEAEGGGSLAFFLTEHQCRYVPMLNPAIDSGSWANCLDAATLDTARGRIALCLDVAMDMNHATLYAAGLMDDGRARVEPIAAWAGQGCTDQLRRELIGLVAKVKPAKLGWFPSGPAAALAADMQERANWPPVGVELEEIRGDVAAVCMGFAEQVTAIKVAHSGDPLLDAHIAGAEKMTHGDGWRFSRKGSGHVDALYAAAGAVHLARTLEEAKPVGVFWA